MPVKFKYPYVNWEDGMKISKHHFIQQENAFIEKLEDANAGFLNSKNYGLLTVPGQTESSLKTVIKLDNQQFLKVKVFDCRAITLGGARIEIQEEYQLSEFEVNISREMETSEGEGEDYFILLSIDNFNRQSFGELDTQEEPPRYPHVIPGYKINVLPAKQILAEGIEPYSLCIGKMNINKDKPEIFDDYIPPCRSINSHKVVLDFYNHVEKFFSKLELDLVSIIRKIRDKEQDTSLAMSVLYMSQKLLEFITRNHLRLRWELSDKEPVLLFAYLATAARVIRNSIDTIAAKDKEELLNYFTNWSELKQGEFEKLLVYCINFNYHHTEILVSIEQFSEVIQIIATLFDKLESLAYIGKKKETNIFVKEQKTKKRSFLAD